MIRTRKPKVTLYPNGKVTISGLDSRDASYFISSATNRLYEQEQEERARAGPRMRYHLHYIRNRIRFLDALRASLDEAIKATHGPEPEPTLKDRLRARATMHQVVRRILSAARTGVVVRGTGGY